MKYKLNFLVRMKISVAKVKEYSLLLKEDLSKAIGYILILSIVVGMVLGVTQFTLLTVLEKSAKIVLKSEEFKFEINDGILDFKNSPYKEEQGSSIVIIDSDKTLDESESLRTITVHKDMSSAFLQDGIIARASGIEYKIKYSDIPFIETYVDNEIALNFLDKVKPIKYIVFLVMIILTYILSLAKALLISVAGVLANNMSGSKLKYKDVFKISIYSLTLPMIIALIIPIGSLSVIISAMYVSVAINNIAKNN
ncbi:MAG: DUF1189 family protein [Terrisporobacter sp.]|uniref:DUF1189 family protein n=1 Tax=Clostridia TaxID=186801 RepID=UPI002FC75D42